MTQPKGVESPFRRKPIILVVRTTGLVGYEVCKRLEAALPGAREQICSEALEIIVRESREVVVHSSTASTPQMNAEAVRPTRSMSIPQKPP